MKKAKIVHLTSAHPRYDIRIFLKMCSSLASAGDDVSLIVADGKGYEVKNNVKIYDVGKPLKKLERILKYSLLVYKRALLLNGDIYHIHDPELLPYAYLLKLKGKKVIFDSHEDTPRQILSKPYLMFPHSEVTSHTPLRAERSSLTNGGGASLLTEGADCIAIRDVAMEQSRNLHSSYVDVINKNLLKMISFAYEKAEKFICGKLDYIITATPFIREIFFKYNPNSIDINNFPIIGELDSFKGKDNNNKLCYVGGIKPIRGIYELVEAMKYVKNKVNLCLAGNFGNGVSYDKIKKIDDLQNVEFKGFLNRRQVSDLLSESFAGVVTFLPVPNHINAQPNKMFEYMSAGLPVIASHFPLWKEIIENNHCGICVDPSKPVEIAKAIDYLFEHEAERVQMGINGKKAVYEKYNWNVEKEKLLKVYEELLNQ